MIGFDNVDDSLHDTGRRESFAVVMCLTDRELGENVLVDPTEHVAGTILDLLTIEDPHQVFEHLGFEDAVVLGQQARQRLKLGLDSAHSVGDQFGKSGAAGGSLLHDEVVPRRSQQVERAAGGVVGRNALRFGILPLVWSAAICGGPRGGGKSRPAPA